MNYLDLFACRLWIIWTIWFSWLSFEQLRGLAVPGLSLAALLPFNLLQSNNPLLCTAWESDPGLDDLKSCEKKNYHLPPVICFKDCISSLCWFHHKCWWNDCLASQGANFDWLEEHQLQSYPQWSQWRISQNTMKQMKIFTFQINLKGQESNTPIYMLHHKNWPKLRNHVNKKV